MAGSRDFRAAGAVEGSGKALETLSQFVARVLDQLSLSAWLPSAALVLLLTFVAQLGAALDKTPKPSGSLDPMGRAFTAIGHISIGGVLLLIAAVVVLTMVTQAFSFEAIRLLEGYWGTNQIIEWCAKRRCQRFRKVRKKLDDRLQRLTKDAWLRAREEIENAQSGSASGSRPWTPDMISVLRSQVLGTMPPITLTEAEMERVRRFDWKKFRTP